MKRIMGIAVTILAVSATCVWGLGIRDYKPPESMLTDADLSASYEYSGQDSTEVNAGKATVRFVQFYESLPFGWNVSASGGLDFNALRETDEVKHSASARGEIHKYFGKDLLKHDRLEDLFGYVSANASSQTDYDNVAMDAFGGIGYGRYINATSMARALRIQEELQEGGIIVGDLEDKVLIDLAAAIDNRSSYELERDYFQAIEEILETSSKIDRLPGVGLYRMTEVLTKEVIQDRYYGYNVGMGVGYEISNPFSDDTADPSAEIYANYAYPFDMRRQFNQSARFQTSLTDFAKSFTLTSTSTFSFEISDRIDNILLYQLLHNKSVLPDDSEITSTSHALTNSFRFYIENRISLNLGISLISPQDESLRKSAVLTLTYDLK